jgi:hypothetical protein
MKGQEKRKVTQEDLAKLKNMWVFPLSLCGRPRRPHTDAEPSASRRIHYSNKYSDDEYDYRHVILPKALFNLIPDRYFNKNGTLKLMKEEECRALGVQQSPGWEHYEVHGESRANASLSFLASIPAKVG